MPALQFRDGRHLLQHEPSGRPLDCRQTGETNVNAGL
jgi:hypothetical protein